MFAGLLKKIFFISLYLTTMLPLFEVPASVPSIRIRVAKSVDRVMIEGIDLEKKIYNKGEMKRYEGRKSFAFNCKNGTGKNRAMLATLSSSTGLISLAEQKYHGDLHIVTSEVGNCDVVNETNLENYIGSLLTKEMNAVWPIEALKAQAVAARSYAYYKMKYEKLGHDLFDLENSERHQVVGDFFDITQNTMKAAGETKGEILMTKKGDLSPIFFHAKCGGRTLRPDQVWENRVPGYVSVLCPYCKGHGGPSWSLKIDSARLREFVLWYAKKFKKPGLSASSGRQDSVQIAPDRETTQELRLYVGEKVYLISKPVFRRYFGRLEIPSNNFKISFQAESYVVTGEGNGHGVGMCQLGALDLADRGWSYKKILAYYFPEHRLKRIY